MVKEYKVICKVCNNTDVLRFDEENHVLLFSRKIMQTPFTAVRWRPDHQWGFECKCGNYNLLASEEYKDFDKLVAGSPNRVKEISSMLKPVTQRFTMEKA